MQEQNAPRDKTVLYHNTLSEGTYTANTFAISLNKKTSPISTPILSHHQSFFLFSHHHTMGNVSSHRVSIFYRIYLVGNFYSILVRLLFGAAIHHSIH